MSSGSPGTDTTFESAMESQNRSDGPSRSETQTSEEGAREPVPVYYTPSRGSSMFESTTTSTSSDSTTEEVLHAHDGYDSPPPLDDRVKAMRDERRYRMYLKHDFHPSRKCSPTL